MDLRSDENTIWKPEWKLCPYIDGEQIETEKIINNGTFTRFVINNKKMVTRQYLDTLRAVRTALSVSRYWL